MPEDDIPNLVKLFSAFDYFREIHDVGHVFIKYLSQLISLSYYDSCTIFPPKTSQTTVWTANIFNQYNLALIIMVKSMNPLESSLIKLQRMG